MTAASTAPRLTSLLDSDTAHVITARVRSLRPDSVRQWGQMDAAQAAAHCAKGIEMALGEFTPPRMFIGKLLGGVIKRLALGSEAPMRRNSPTVPAMVMTDPHDLAKERDRLCGLIDRFAAAGPAGCSTHPHSFFGRLTPHEWGVLMYKHLDHHLRQFGA